ncbi:MAG: GNAT family N-acetyltransferase [Bryobacteraceae bacterium]|nr:GNAT family N-acetyltransferase [Bryobacteraceae bacterium]
MELRVAPLTPKLWPALEELFATNRTCNQCWCMYWRIGSAYRNRAGGDNKSDFRQLVREDDPPGHLAFDGGKPVGWLQLTPRGALPALERNKRLARVDEVPVWSISCFFVRVGYRKRGVTEALIAAAIAAARKAGAPALEAYPVDAGETSSSSFTGYLSTFLRLGFREVERRAPARPIVRYEF